MNETAVRIENLTSSNADGAVPPVNDREVWRYAGYRGASDANTEMSALLSQVKQEIIPLLSYRVCWFETALQYKNGIPCPPFSARSANLEKLLAGCERITIFAATIGIELDRRITRYSRLSPSKALLLQAIGAERVEALADAFCISRETEGCEQTRRFSPGYGDLPLSVQKDFMRLLDCGKRIGITLNESLIMSPSKSVTAIFGLKPAAQQKRDTVSGCAACADTRCEYRRNDK